MANGWGWFYLLMILDDYSRYIIALELCTTMKLCDVTDTLNLALQASGCDQATVLPKPRPLSDNCASYLSGELADWLKDRQMDHVRGAPHHPQTQGKIKRSYQTLKNRILMEIYYLPGDLRQQIDGFVEHCNHRRYHESLQNLTQPMSTAGGARPSRNNEKGSYERPSKPGACFTANPPHNQTNQMCQILSWIRQPSVAKSLTTDMIGLCRMGL